MSSQKEKKYFNFPIQLLEGFMVDSEKCLKNIFDYSIVCYTQKIEKESVSDKLRKAEDYFGVKIGNKEKTFNNGNELIDLLPVNSPKSGISKELYFEFYKNDKSEFDKVCLLGFLAIKSIILAKPYSKITNDYWFSRMSGKINTIKVEDLPPDLSKYLTERLTRKIKFELSNKWGLVTYSRYTRGFYASFTLSLEDLIYQAEIRRKTRIEKIQKEAEKQAYINAMKKINTN